MQQLNMTSDKMHHVTINNSYAVSNEEILTDIKQPKLLLFFFSKNCFCHGNFALMSAHFVFRFIKKN